MKIRTKLGIYFAIIFAVFGAISFLVIYYNYTDDNSFSQKINDSIASIDALSKQGVIAQLVRYDDEVLTQSARNYTFTGDKKWKDRYFEFVPKLDLRIREAIDFGDVVDKEIFDGINDANQALVKMEEQAIALSDSRDFTSAREILESQEYARQKDIYKAGIDKYISRHGVSIDTPNAISVGLLQDAHNYFLASAKTGLYLLLVFISFSTIVIIFLIYIILFLFLKPLNIFKNTAKRIIGGELDAKVIIPNKDEIGEFASDFNKMTLNLKTALKDTQKIVKEQTKEIGAKADDLRKQKEAILNVLEDVEEEKKVSEALAQDLEKFRLAVANASDHIIISDKEGIVLFANTGVEMITGFSAKDILGKKAGISEFWGGLMTKDFYAKMWKTIKTDKKTFAGQIENKRKNGERYFAWATISPILDKNGEVKFFVAIERDISKEVQIDRAKTEFVSLASHQLRTPLSAINWYAEMLLAGDAGKLTKEQDQYVKEIYAGNQRMVDLVNALLNISRIDLGTFAVEPEPTDFCAVAKSLLAELKPQIEAKKIAISLDCEKGLPIINADPKLVRIIFQNLMTNALKYTPEKGKVAFSLSQKGKNVLIKISDTGYGIPEAAKSKIFTKLFRADNVREHDAEGTGLGLYMVKAIVEESQGKIWFESTENKGTTFYVSLPISGMKKKEGSKELSSIK